MSDLPESTDAGGKIVTFYSYKGGTGRSMALANLAWILASNGQRVLAIDWDLEAPGLHRYFQPFLRDKTLAASEGVIDFIIDFAAGAVSPPPQVKEGDAEWYTSYANLLEYATSLEWEFPDSGTIDFVPAGRQDAGYAVRVNSFHWQHFYTKLGGGVFLEEVKRRLRGEYDYILIDSRTGVSDTSGVCTVQMPDDLVVCFTLNQQSIEGASASAQSAREQRKRPDGSDGIRVLPLMTRVDSSEKEKLDTARGVARDYFDGFLEWLDEDQVEEYWGSAQVPYVPFYAYEEVLAAFGDAPFQKGTVLSAIESLASRITDAAVPSLGRIPDQLRLETLQRFARQPRTPRIAATKSIFYVSYARQDHDDQMTRLFTDLTNEVRGLTGLPIEEVGYFDWTRMRPGDDFGTQTTAALSASQVGVCLLSPSYLRSEYCLRELESFRAQGKPVVLVDWIPWRSGEDTPDIVQQTMRFGAGSQGFRALLRLKGQYDQYQLQLGEIANVIAGLWEKGTNGAPAESAVDVPFIVLAERSDGIRTVRSNARPYGTRRSDWKPFWSMQGQSASEIARETGKRVGTSLPLTSIHKARELFIHSRKPTSGGIVLVDPWTLLISEHKQFLKELVKRANDVPLFWVVCFDHDGETSQRRSELDALVRSLAGDGESLPPLIVDSPEGLDKILDEMCGRVIASRGSVRKL